MGHPNSLLIYIAIKPNDKLAKSRGSVTVRQLEKLEGRDSFNYYNDDWTDGRQTTRFPKFVVTQTDPRKMKTVSK